MILRREAATAYSAFGAPSFLARVPPSTRDRLLAHAEPFAFAKEHVIVEPQTKPRFAHFLTSGLVKLSIPSLDGEGVVCSLMGIEGLPESFHLLGQSGIPARCVVQTPTTVLRVEIEVVERLFAEDQRLRDCILHLMQCETAVAWQLVSCNALHNLEQRLARLLLMVHDRLPENDLPLTHECVGRMLGARRSSVSVTAAKIQRHGSIEYRRGSISVLDRKGLEQAACECYPVFRRLYQELISRVVEHG